LLSGRLAIRPLNRAEEVMTICIACICDSGSSVVVVADRMLTAEDIEFEQDTCKILELSTQCVALTAGSALAHVDLLREAVPDIRARATPSISEITDVVKQHFADLRKRRAEERLSKPIGMTIEDFLAHQGELNPDVVLRLNRQLELAELDLEVLVAGVDEEGAHIHWVFDPGSSECFDSVGFCALGSGERHAETSFIRNRYSLALPLRRALYFAYEAKRESEVAPGVGKDFTDVAIIRRQEGC